MYSSLVDCKTQFFLPFICWFSQRNLCLCTDVCKWKASKVVGFFPGRVVVFWNRVMLSISERMHLNRIKDTHKHTHTHARPTALAFRDNATAKNSHKWVENVCNRVVLTYVYTENLRRVKKRQHQPSSSETKCHYTFLQWLCGCIGLSGLNCVEATRID